MHTLVAYERVERVRLARGVLAARDATHLVTGERHARGRGERLVRPCDGRKPLGSLTALLPAAAEVGGDRHRARHADQRNAAREYLLGGLAAGDPAGQHQWQWAPLGELGGQLQALVSAVATLGYRELAERLAAAHPSPATPEQLTSVAVAYVQFALERPALFRIMFGEPCDRDNDERTAATAAVALYLREIVGRVFPEADTEAMATATWALVHGLASLHLDGKLDAPTPTVVAERVTAAIQALLTATSIDEHPVHLR